MNGIERRFRLAVGGMQRSARLLAAGARLPLRKHYLVLRCARGADASGLFSEFAAVLGALEHYERWQPIYAGLRVDFGDEGLYYDPAHGPNWWEYHFERIELGDRAPGNAVEVDDWQHDMFAYRLPALVGATGHDLVRRHIRPVARIRSRVDAVVRMEFAETPMIGVHYRGTDKHQDAPRVPYERVADAVRAAAASMGSPSWKVFVATDEQAFLDFMVSRFPGRLHSLPMRRSTNGRPISHAPGDPFRKGEDAVADCLLLARCRHLIRTASNLSLCAALFNPELRVDTLNAER